MEAIDGWGVVSFAVLAIVLFGLAQYDLAVTWVLEKILEPVVRWFQRVFLGIDQPRAGPEALIGCNAAANAFHREQGQYIGSVRIEGETWRARANSEIAEGSTVRVVSREGLTLLVEPARKC